MQKVDQLNKSIDTLQRDFNTEKEIFSQNFQQRSIIAELLKSSKKISRKEKVPNNILDFIENDRNWKVPQIINTSIEEINSQKRTLNNKKLLYFFTQKRINLHIIELNNKYSLIFSSLFLFLIGASLGAIIRKGGVGFPLVLSVIIFLTFHYIGLFSKNAAEDSSIDPFIGSWISTLIIAPISIILTRRASSDKGFINFDFTLHIFKNFINPLKRFQKNER
tara:strand:- start:1670 stop:2332 length:663 start_codon:yes stop_codon:yes gene_type:complete